MKKSRNAVIAATCIFILMGCYVTPQLLADPKPYSSSNLVIGHLSARDKLITISTGSFGPVYSIKSLTGQTIAEELSLSALVSQFPDLSVLIKKGVAWDDASLGPTWKKERTGHEDF